MYEARVIETIGNGEGHWDYLKIGIFRDGDQIGEYERNYSSFYRTFFPFSQAGKDYALYSRHYAATRIMALPSCEDLGGEESDGGGFCPIEFWVPRVRFRMCKSLVTMAGSPPECFIDCEYDNDKGFDDSSDDPVLREESRHLNFGFAAGCFWGDDSSWKIEHLDLSRASDGKLLRTDLVGYKDMPSWLENFGLRQAIHFMDFNSKFVPEGEAMAIPLAERRGKRPIKHRFVLAIQGPDYYDWDEAEACGVINAGDSRKPEDGSRRVKISGIGVNL